MLAPMATMPALFMVYCNSLKRGLKMTRNIKRTFQIIILLFSIFTGIYLFFNIRIGFIYNKCIFDEVFFTNITSTRSLNNDLVYSISFNNEELFFDSTNNFYLYSLIKDSSESYNPTINIVSDYPDIKVAFNSAINSEIIESDQDISIIVYNDDYYYESKLKCTTLPIISINTNSNISDSKYESTEMNFKIYDNRPNVFTRLTDSEGSIHIRGASSLIYPKRSFRLALSYTKNGNITKNKISLLGMRKDEDWILYSIYDDPEKVRNVFSTNLWNNSVSSDNDSKLDTGTEYKYVELFMNGEYYGLYALGYPMQASQISIAKDTPNAAMFRRLMGYENNNILLESDGAPASFRIQSNSEQELFSLLRDYFIQVDKSHNDADALASLIDLDNATDFFLFINLIQGWDNIYKNQNLAIYKGDNSQKALYIPWDMDLTWGISTDKVLYGIDFKTNFEFNYGAFYTLLQHSPESTIPFIQKKYESLRESEWSDECVLNMLDSYEKDIFLSGAYLRDMQRWPEGSYIGASSVGEKTTDILETLKYNSTNNLSQFKDYVIARLHYMDYYVSNLASDQLYEYKPLSFGSDIIYDCVSQLFSDSNELVLIEINNPELWNEDYYNEIMSNWGIPTNYVAKRVSLKSQLADQYYEYNGETIDDEISELSTATDLVIMYDNDEFSFCNNFFKNGSCETEVGKLIYYQADDGSSGIYLDDNEIITENAFDKDFDLRVIHIDADSHEAIRIEEHKVYEE